jgi:hypothetical protein
MTDLQQIKETWQPPVELNSSSPREVCLSWTGKALAGLAVALILGSILAGPVFYLQTSHEREVQGQMAKSGLNSEAEIARHWISENNPKHYWLEYEYSVGGASYTGSISIKRDSWLSLQKPGKLRIR